MSKKQEIQNHLQQLQSISEILGAMKNLAVLESQQVARKLVNLRQLAEELEHCGGDLSAFHGSLIDGDGGEDIFVLIGSERGFCAEFNERLAAHVDTDEFKARHSRARLVLVGEKLHSQMGSDSRVIEELAGANVVDDIQAVLTALVDCLAGLTTTFLDLHVTALYHDSELQQIIEKPVMPPRLPQQTAPARQMLPPMLYLPAEQVLQELLYQYVFVLLNEIAHLSLSAENYFRAQHLGGAINRLDEARAGLTRQYHRQRQEEIIEEIEVILLNTVE